MSEDPRISRAHEDEVERCRQSPAYFYNNYCKKPDMPNLTDEQVALAWKSLQEQRVRTRNPDHAHRVAFFMKYPLTIDEVFKKQ
jgi:hypothetical protein